MLGELSRLSVGRGWGQTQVYFLGRLFSAPLFLCLGAKSLAICANPRADFEFLELDASEG